MEAMIDIYLAAMLLVEKNGQDAQIIAAMEADACAESGDLDGKNAWLKVIETIKVLQTTSAVIH